MAIDYWPHMNPGLPPANTDLKLDGFAIRLQRESLRRLLHFNHGQIWKNFLAVYLQACQQWGVVMNASQSNAIRLLNSVSILAIFWGGFIKVAAQEQFYTATNLWKVDVGNYNRSSPAMDLNGILYLTTFDGRLLAISPDGTHLWSFKFGFESVSTPAVGSDGTIYFGSRNRNVYAVAANGKKQWEFTTGAWVDASAAIGNSGDIFIGSWDKIFYCLSPQGQQKWTFQTAGPIVSSAAIDNEGNIYFGSHDHTFYALGSDGSKRWSFTTQGAIISSPALDANGEIYFTSTDGLFYRLTNNGELKWKLRTGGFTASSPVLGSDGTIYLSVNQTHCAFSTNGKLLWQRNFWHPQANYFGETSASVVADGTVIFTGGDGYVMTVPVDNGANEFVWNYWLFGASYSSSLVGPDGTVYVLALPKELHALKNNASLAQSSWPMFRGNPQRTGRMYEPK